MDDAVADRILKAVEEAGEVVGAAVVGKAVWGS
jgi:hypothetical protein